MATKNLPTKPGYYWALVNGVWEPVSVFFQKENKEEFAGVVLIGSDKFYNAAETEKMIAEFDDKIVQSGSQCDCGGSLYVKPICSICDREVF